MKQETIKIQVLNDTKLCVLPVLPDMKTIVPVESISGLTVSWGIHGHETEPVATTIENGYIVLPISATMPLGVYSVHMQGTINGEQWSDNRYEMFELVKYGEGIRYDRYYTKTVVVGLPDSYVEELRRELEEKIGEAEAAKEEADKKAEEYAEKIMEIDGIEDMVGAKQAFDTMKRIKPYLYGMEYDSLNYEEAREHMLNAQVAPSACTTVRSGAEVGRNFDWAISKQVEFLVRTKAHNGRYATIGFCGALPTLTDAVARGGKYRDEYRYLPFYMQDGMNSDGLVATIHQLPDNAMRRQSAGGNTPLVEERERMSAVMLVRYVLDNFKSAMEAAEYIRDFVRVIPANEGGKQLDCQYAIADKDSTVYVAFEGESVVIEQHSADSQFVMTNFRLAGTTLVDGVYDIEQSGIEDYGQGVERANAAIGYAGMDMIDMLAHDVNFTQAYTTENRLTEFAGMDHEGAIATIHDTEALQAIQESAASIYQTEESAGTLREKGDLWQTVHSVVYDIEAKTLRYVTQEIDGDTEEIVVEGVFGDESDKSIRFIAAEYEQGKANVVEALNSLGIEATTQETITELATKIGTSGLNKGGSVLTNGVSDFGNALCNNVIELKSDKIITLPQYALAAMSQLKRVILPNCITFNASFRYTICNIEDYYLPKCTTLGRGMFRDSRGNYSTVYAKNLYAPLCNQSTSICDYDQGGTVYPSELRHATFGTKCTFSLAATTLFNCLFPPNSSGSMLSKLYDLNFYNTQGYASMNFRTWIPSIALQPERKDICDHDEWDDTNEPTEGFENNRAKFLWYFERHFIPSFGEVTTSPTLTLYSGVYNVIAAAPSMDDPSKTLLELLTDKGWNVASV